MKLIGTEMGRVIVVLILEEIRPVRGLAIKTSIDMVQNRYEFLKAPNLSEPIEILDRDGYKFQNGKISYDGETFVIGELIILREVVSVTALRTEHADAFLDDFISWSQESLEFRPSIIPPDKKYLSQIHVTFDQDLESIMAQHAKITALIKNRISQQTGIDLPTHLTRLDFGFDPGQISGLRPASFALERRVGVPYAENRFFSEAPLPTQDHINLLESFETLLS